MILIGLEKHIKRNSTSETIINNKIQTDPIKSTSSANPAGLKAPNGYRSLGYERNAFGEK